MVITCLLRGGGGEGGGVFSEKCVVSKFYPPFPPPPHKKMYPASAITSLTQQFCEEKKYEYLEVQLIYSNKIRNTITVRLRVVPIYPKG